jgi:hypothetical protein
VTQITRTARRALVGVLLLYMLVGGPVWLLAQTQPERIRFQVRLIHAVKGERGEDPSVRSVVRKVESARSQEQADSTEQTGDRAAHPEFSSYRDLGQTTGVTEMNRPLVLKVPGERALSLLPAKREPDGSLAVQLQLSEMFSATVHLVSGESVILGGPKFADGVLILSITAWPEQAHHDHDADKAERDR